MSSADNTSPKRRPMGRIIATEFVSLDGVVEAPGGGEDFEYAGWSFEIDRGEEGNKFNHDEEAHTTPVVQAGGRRRPDPHLRSGALGVTRTRSALGWQRNPTSKFCSKTIRYGCGFRGPVPSSWRPHYRSRRGSACCSRSL